MGPMVIGPVFGAAMPLVFTPSWTMDPRLRGGDSSIWQGSVMPAQAGIHRVTMTAVRKRASTATAQKTGHAHVTGRFV